MQQKSRLLAIGLLLLVCSSVLALMIPPAVRASETTVLMGDSFFSPQEVTITVGASIVWKNNGTLTHTSTSDSGLWDSGSVPPSNTYVTPPFAKVGVYNYHSKPDTQMTGKIIVVSADASTLFPGTVNSGVTVLYILGLFGAGIIILYLNYPSAKAKARLR